MTKHVLASEFHPIIISQHKLAPQALLAEKSEALIRVTLVLRRPALPPLDHHDEQLPEERKYLTLEELDAYGASQEDIASVTGFAAKAGLTVVKADARAAIIQMSGSPEAIKAAFNIGGEKGPLNAHVPAALGEAVQWIFGLDDRRLTRPVTGFRTSSERTSTFKLRSQKTDSLVPVAYTSCQVASLYDYPRVRGEGQCLGIIALAGGYNQKDMEEYFLTLGLGKDEMPEIVNVGSNSAIAIWVRSVG